METLMGSCWNIFPPKFGEKDKLIWLPVDVSLSRKENRFPRNRKRDLLLGFSLSVSYHCRTVRSVAPENQTLVETEESDQTLVADQHKTSHVRFTLTKECAFGQHFLIVGDDPCLGLWDPSDGVRFDWSDGHLWTAELDVPTGKMIKYKFILKLDDNTILWQPGPDRILETWETEKTIVVFEDWDHPQFQDITEEEQVLADVNDEKSLINPELATVSENLSKTTQDGETDAKKQLVVLADVNDEKSLINSELPTVFKSLSKTAQDDGTDAKKQHVGTNEQSSLDDNVKQDSNTNINYSEHGERSDLEQEAPVLLQGLIPLLTKEIDEESPNEVKDEELKDEHNSASLLSTETSEAAVENEKGSRGKERLEILEGDMLWGRGIVKKFLAILGF